MQQISPILQNRSRQIASGLILFVALISLACISGWACEVQDLKALYCGRNMLLRSSVAVAFLLLSLSLLIYQYKQYKKTVLSKAFSLSLAAIVFVSSIALFVESISSQDFSLSRTLFALNQDSTGVTFPGPMPPNVSLHFLFLSAAVIFLNFQGRILRLLWQASALVSLCLAITAFFGFLCGVDSLCTLFGCVRMPCTISLPFAMLSLACFGLRLEDSAGRIFLTDSLGGRIARRFLTLALAVPVSLAVRSIGCAFKLYDEAFGWAVFGMLIFASFTFVVIWSARTLDILDSLRQEAEKKHEVAEIEKENIERKLVSEVAKKVVLDNSMSGPLRLKNVCLSCTKEYSVDMDYCPDDQTMLTQLPDDSVIGTAFADKYYIIEELGSGGMSTVYKARHLFLEHQILAIKVLKSHLASNTVSVKRFQHEARTASRLSHANLIKIHDFGVSRSGQPYLCMDFVKGKSLRELLHECKRLDLPRFYQLFEQILAGIAIAHQHGIVHRDLKPGNIMIIENENKEEQVKIVDFGLAKDDSPEDMRLTATGEVCGSPMYMSPEQWQGGKVGAACDIYALGCVMFESLSGEPPYNKESVFELMLSHAQAELPAFPESLKLPAHLEAAVLACLAKEPAKRPASAALLQKMISGAILEGR